VADLVLLRHLQDLFGAGVPLLAAVLGLVLVLGRGALELVLQQRLGAAKGAGGEGRGCVVGGWLGPALAWSGSAVYVQAGRKT